MSKNNISELIEKLSEAHGDKTESVEVFEDIRLSVTVKPDYFVELAKVLRDDYGFDMPIGGGAIDYPEENRMQMIYHLNRSEDRLVAVYRVNLNRDAPVLPTLTTVWEAMSFHERETHEMFGIEFEGHENMLPLLLPPDWKGGYPLRKDFKGDGVE